MVLALLVVFVFFTYLTGGRLLLAQNISNLLLQNAYVLIMACGMLLCILTGGNVDLSVGSTLCLSAALSAKLLSVGTNPIVAILASLGVACIIGIWQGWLIGYVHIPPFICTLAGMFLFRGLARVILDSKTIAIMDKKFLSLFTSYIQIPPSLTVSKVRMPLKPSVLLAFRAFLFRFETKKIVFYFPLLCFCIVRI